MPSTSGGGRESAPSRWRTVSGRGSLALLGGAVRDGAPDVDAM
ncbi:MAG: hypothetical protein ACPGPE_14425 [Planctomycetota bacterium]